jgi:hypothetical protein
VRDEDGASAVYPLTTVKDDPLAEFDNVLKIARDDLAAAIDEAIPEGYGLFLTLGAEEDPDDADVIRVDKLSLLALRAISTRRRGA